MKFDREDGNAKLDDYQMKEVIEKRPTAYIIIGPPTSGKTSLSIDIGERLNAQSITGRRVSESIDLGLTGNLESERKLMPDDKFIPVLKDILGKLNGGAVVLDNIPRTDNQSKALIEWAEKTGYDIKVVVLNLTEQQVIERAEKRQICPECGASYHPDLKPSTKNGVCDIDGTNLKTRSGDKPETLKAGFRNYLNLKKDVINSLSKAAKIFVFDINGTTADTKRAIFDSFGL